MRLCLHAHDGKYQGLDINGEMRSVKSCFFLRRYHKISVALQAKERIHEQSLKDYIFVLIFIPFGAVGIVPDIALTTINLNGK